MVTVHCASRDGRQEPATPNHSLIPQPTCYQVQVGSLCLPRLPPVLVLPQAVVLSGDSGSSPSAALTWPWVWVGRLGSGSYAVGNQGADP